MQRNDNLFEKITRLVDSYQQKQQHLIKLQTTTTHMQTIAKT